MRVSVEGEHLAVIDHVIGNWDKFVKWPQRGYLLLPGVDRTNKYHTYPDTVTVLLKDKKIAVDTRSNGPAIVSYLQADGIRPTRKKTNRKWSVHHIYDGQFPWPDRNQSLHAVKDSNHFTQSAGLVAIHPIADALADEFSYFAWLLRLEAFLRFGYDPDEVFKDPEKV